MERPEKMSFVLWNQLPTVEVSLDQVMLQMDGGDVSCNVSQTYRCDTETVLPICTWMQRDD